MTFVDAAGGKGRGRTVHRDAVTPWRKHNSQPPRAATCLMVRGLSPTRYGASRYDPRGLALAAQPRLAGAFMTPRKTTVEQSKGVFEVEWPMFGELSRALALKVVRDCDPEVVVGVATAGVVPGAVIAAILDREFHSIIVSRRYQAESVRETPAVFGAVPPAVRGRRVLIVDETCDSGATMRLAVGAIA